MKKETETSFRDRQVVPKNHPQIRFRGELDSLIASFLLVQYEAEQDDERLLRAQLEEIIQFCHQILSVEVTGKSVQLDGLLGMTFDQIRAHSQNPLKYIGVDHILPTAQMGKWILKINILRTQVRETELAAVDAFIDDTSNAAQQILMSLNRLSSALYILMCRKYREQLEI